MAILDACMFKEEKKKLTYFIFFGFFVIAWQELGLEGQHAVVDSINCCGPQSCEVELVL